MADQGHEAGEFERLCCHCNFGFPSEADGSEFGICLHDQEFEPFLDDILERQDFGRCRQLVKNKRFDWDHEACTFFDPIEDLGIECSPELAATLGKLAEQGELTAEAVERRLLEDHVSRVNWQEMPVDSYVDQLNRAITVEQRDPILQQLGGLVTHENRDAFDALCDILRKQELPATLPQSHLKCSLLGYLSRSKESRKELADVLVDDLLRTPSNPQTRCWYAGVFHFFEYTAPEFAEECLGRILGSPQFSYRIKRRVREIIRRSNEMW